MTLRVPTIIRLPSPDAARPRPAPSAPPPRQPALAGFSEGTLLAGLTDLHPKSRHSCCELIGVVFGIENSGNAALKVAYSRLMALCEHLPASVPGRAGIQRQLDTLREDVAAFKNKHIEPEERYDELDRLNRFSRRAFAVHQAIEAHEAQMRRRQQRQALNQDVVPMAPAGDPPVTYDFGGAGPQDGDASATLRRREVPRRRDLQGDAVAPVAAPQAPVRPAFALDAAGHRALRRAIDTARQQANGLNRIGGRDMLVLGREIAALVNGRFTARSAHASDMRARQHDIGAVVHAATNSMRHDQRDAIRAAAERYLQDDHAGHLD